MKFTTAEAIQQLQYAWINDLEVHADPDAERIAHYAKWNAICDVLGYADRFKL